MLKGGNLIRAKSFLSKRFASKIEKSFPGEHLFEVKEKTGLIFTLQDKPGILLEALKVFFNHGVNLTYINSRPSKYLRKESKSIEFFVDLEGSLSESKVQQSLSELKKMTSNVEVFHSEEVPWFPKTLMDLNKIGRTLLSANDALTGDHPGFKDEVYRKRRQEIVNISNSYNMEEMENIPVVNYSEEETELWGYLWDKLVPLHRQHACEEFQEAFKFFVDEKVLSKGKVPQVKEVSRFLKQKTNTVFRPVGGLLTQREFLNGLAFRVFHSTQYLRHKSTPLYTPEPDIVHEILGHAPLFAIKDFADFSQEIGLASLGVSDQEIERLGTIYWFTVEFGICLQRNQKKIYGAGILSSPQEIEWAMSDQPNFHPFDIFKIANFPFTITDIQHNYFLAPSFAEMKKLVIKYAETIKRPFNVTYNVEEETIDFDRSITYRKEATVPH